MAESLETYSGTYWTSAEFNAEEAIVFIGNYFTSSRRNKSEEYLVRPIRVF